MSNERQRNVRVEQLKKSDPALGKTPRFVFIVKYFYFRNVCTSIVGDTSLKIIDLLAAC